MSGDLIPEEAGKAFYEARSDRLWNHHASPSAASWAGLEAAAPLILAAELARMADAMDRSLWPDPMGQFSAEQAHAARVMKQDALKVLRSRVSVLRGEGDRQ